MGVKQGCALANGCNSKERIGSVAAERAKQESKVRSRSGQVPVLFKTWDRSTSKGETVVKMKKIIICCFLSTLKELTEPAYYVDTQFKRCAADLGTMTAGEVHCCFVGCAKASKKTGEHMVPHSLDLPLDPMLRPSHEAIAKKMQTKHKEPNRAASATTTTRDSCLMHLSHQSRVGKVGQGQLGGQH